MASLTEMSAEWLDDVAVRIIEMIKSMPMKPAYSSDDVERLLQLHFDDGKAACRLFLGLSKDEFETGLAQRLGAGNTGLTSFKLDRVRYLAALDDLGIPGRMTLLVNTPVIWSDLLIERLRSGRGRAIRGLR